MAEKSSVPFMKIKQASKTVGLSEYALRQGCRDGSIPHLRAGRDYLIDVEKLLERLHEQAQGNGDA